MCHCPYAEAMLGSQGAQAVRVVRSYARWMTTAKPGDYVIALSGAAASVPVVGRHLEILGGFASLGVGGRRYVSSVAAGVAQARLGPRRGEQLQADLALTPSVLTAALEGIVAPDDLAQPWPSH